MTDGSDILIPLDGSKLAEHSLAYVSAMRPLGLSEVCLFSAVDPISVTARRGHEDEERARNLLTSYLHTLADELRAQTTLDVRTKVVSGPVPEAILAEAQHSDYLIISTHGASGLSRWRFGSVADKVIRGAECPTLVVGPVAAERGSWLEARLMPVFRSVMVPLDGSELAEQALPEARRFADAFGCRVHVVTAVTTNYVGPSEAWAGISPQLAEDFIADAGKYLDEIQARAPGMEDATFAVKIGAPAQALIDYIDENRIDLVIMTSHGRGGFIRTALGSTTDRMLGGAAPVLILRAHSE